MSGNLRGIMDAARKAKEQPEQIASEAEIDKPPAAPEPSLKPIRPMRKVVTPTVVLAKSVDPNFMQLKVYVRKETKKAAVRKWEDTGSGDMSELIETLLTKYLKNASS